MKFETIRSLIKGIPYIDPAMARVLYDFILDKKPRQCLELGFAHGASSCYIAAALDELGDGHLTSVDLAGQDWQQPAIELLLARTDLGEYVTVVRENTSYTWFLKKKIEENTTDSTCQPIYDFCFFDGSKHWTIDGCAFFLADKLLKQGGWILFDDLNWTFGSTGRTQTDGVNHREMGADELHTPHVDRIFRLLVMQHPDYSEFEILDNWWAWAHKVRSASQTRTLRESASYRVLLLRGLRRAGRLLGTKLRRS